MRKYKFYNQLEKNQTLHAAKIFLRDVQMFADYLKLEDDIKIKFPNLYQYIQSRYYNDVISKKFNLTPNYVLSKVHTLKRMDAREFEHLKIIANQAKNDDVVD